jgi:predicted permease
MLLIGAGLMIRSFVRLQGVSPGFNPDRVISMRLGSNSVRSPELERLILQRIAVVPGVKALGAITSIPFTPGDYGWWWIGVEGFTPQPGQEQQVELRAASSDYFRTMGIPLLKGRFLSDHDTLPDAQRVILIDQKFAQHFWPGSDPVGKHVWNERIGHPSRNWREAQNPLTIVGVVGTVKQYGLDVDGRMVLYAPSIGLLPYLVARTSTDPVAVAPAIVREIHSLAPAVSVDEIRTMEDRMNNSLARQRFSTLMLGAFSVFALILAAIGVYGVMSYLVTQSTHDLGVRIALGAQRTSIVSMVVRQGLELAGVGIVAGIIGALALTRVMASLLFGVSATDILTFSVVPLILAMIALFATYLPARRATQVDPIVVLRED